MPLSTIGGIVTIDHDDWSAAELIKLKNGIGSCLSRLRKKTPALMTRSRAIVSDITIAEIILDDHSLAVTLHPPVVHGHGLVSKTVFETNDTILIVRGLIIPRDKVQTDDERAYTWGDDLSAFAVCQFDKSHANAARWINSAATFEARNVDLLWINSNTILTVVATRPIQIDEELLAYYSFHV